MQILLALQLDDFSGSIAKDAKKAKVAKEENIFKENFLMVDA
jgi:hypothetical protein